MPHFPEFLFGPNIFLAEKNSIGDITYLWHLKTAQTTLLSYETVDLEI